MADTKITALTAITTVDPAVDVLPIVDISDTTMAASGTTKKITTNQILGSGGTATLASATISGDLTVDTNVLKVDTTNNRVGIGTATPLNAGHIQGTGQATVTPTVTGDGSALSLIDSQTVANNGGMLVLGSICSNGNFGQVGIKSLLTNGLQNGTSALAFFTRAAVADTTLSERYRIAADGVATWSNVGGVAGTAMTLNSTGLGVGTIPGSATGNARFAVLGGATYDGQFNVTANFTDTALSSAKGVLLGYNNTTNNGIICAAYGGGTEGLQFWTHNGSSWGQRMELTAIGNLGLGVTPSAWNASFRGIDISTGGAIAGSSDSVRLFSNSAFNTAGNNVYKNAATAGRYDIQGNVHTWSISTNAPSAGGTITFSPAMTLDASGNLLVGTTSNTNSSRVFVRGTGTNPSLAIQGATGDLAQPGLLVGKFDNDSTTSQILVRFTINNNAAGSGQINANGASQAAFGSFSDSRLKENIVSLPSQLANILSLRPVEFDYKDGSGHQIGFVAQEMQEVYSDAVGEQNGFLTVTGWSKTEARLVSAIKELAAKVQALEAKLA